VKTIHSAMLLATVAGLAVSGPSLAEPKPAGAIYVTVTGLRSTNGQLIACIWHEKSRFPSCEKSKTALRRAVSVTGLTMQVSLPLTAPGRYAVTVVHDEDGNGKTKHNFIGMPLEGVGISNNPGGMPGFEKSLVDMSPGSAITVRMKYLFG